MMNDSVDDKEADMNRLWIPDRRPGSSSLLSRIRHWWFPLLIALVLLLLIISLGVVNAQSSKRLTSLEKSASKMNSVVQPVNLSVQQEMKKEVKQLQFEVEDHKTQLTSVSEALKQLAALDSLKESVTALKWTIEGIMNTSEAREACPPRWELFGSSCYFFSRLPLNWNQSRDWCQQQAAHLVILNTKEEWDFVKVNTVPQFFWVGLSDSRTGHWEWVNQTPYVMKRSEWVPGQPDNWEGDQAGKGTEDCAHMHNSGRLNDLHCFLLLRFVCQRPSRKM